MIYTKSLFLQTREEEATDNMALKILLVHSKPKQVIDLFLKEVRKPTQELYDISKMLDEKNSEIERLKQERVGLQVKMTKVTNGIIKLSTDLLVKMFSESRVRGGRGKEVKYFYLKS